MIFHVHVDNFIKKLFEIVISESFKKFLNILANSQFESPLLIIKYALNHRNQILHCCLFADDLMQVTNMCNDTNSNQYVLILD